MWRFFGEQLLQVLDRFVPLKEPWMTRHLEHLFKRKKEAYLRLRKQGSDRVVEVYKVARKEVKNGLGRARSGYEQTLAGRIKENLKAFYAYVRNKRMAR
eukprot:g13875.t1